MPLSADDKLGHYEILAPLGAGGLGEVYRARDTRLNRTVAVKVLPEHIAKLEERRARFEPEARVVASLNHPSICTLFDIGDQEMPRGRRPTFNKPVKVFRRVLYVYGATKRAPGFRVALLWPSGPQLHTLAAALRVVG